MNFVTLQWSILVDGLWMISVPECVCVFGGGGGQGLTTGLPLTLCAIYKLESF